MILIHTYIEWLLWLHNYIDVVIETEVSWYYLDYRLVRDS